MPSSKLLKHLLSEPIRSWRRHEPNLSAKSSVKLSAVDLDAISIEDSLELKASDRTREGLCEESEKKCILLPGLIGKPPLPKKDLTNKETNRSDSGIVTDDCQFNAKYNSLFENSSPSSSHRKNKTDLEKMECETKEPTKGASQESTAPAPFSQTVDHQKSFKGSLRDAIMEDSELRLLFYGNFDDEQKSLDGLSSISNPDVVQNWTLEDNKIDKEVYMNEKQTDLYLDTLKKQQETFGEDVQAEKSKDDIGKTEEEVTDEKFRKFFEARVDDKYKENNCNAFQNKRDEESSLTKKLKNRVTIRYNKPSISPHVQNLPKPRFTPTAIKPKKDVVEDPFEEDSWMSKYDSRETSNDVKNKDIDKWITDNSKIEASGPKHVSYNDVLENLEELEEETIVSEDNKLDDQASSGTIDDGAYQDMVSILHDLEDAGKVSRK